MGEFFHQKVFSLVSFYSAFPAAPPPPAQCDMEILSSSSSATLAGTGNGGDQQKTQQNYELQPVLRSPVGPPRKTLTMVTSSTGESFIPDYPDLLNIQQPPASNRPPPTSPKSAHCPTTDHFVTPSIPVLALISHITSAMSLCHCSKLGSKLCWRLEPSLRN